METKITAIHQVSPGCVQTVWLTTKLETQILEAVYQSYREGHPSRVESKQERSKSWG